MDPASNAIENNPVSPEKKVQKRKQGKCYNCKSTKAYQFYPCKDGTGNKECSSCYVFRRRNGVARDPDPEKNKELGFKMREKTNARKKAEMKARGEVIKPRPPKSEEELRKLKKANDRRKKFRCGNCTTNETPIWLRNIGGCDRVCRNCYRYFQAKNMHRPFNLEVKRDRKLKAAGKEPESGDDGSAKTEGERKEASAEAGLDDEENVEWQRPGPSDASKKRTVSSNPQPPRRKRVTFNLESEVIPEKKKAEVVTRKIRKGIFQGSSDSEKSRDLVSVGSVESDEALNDVMRRLSTLTDEQTRKVVRMLTKKTAAESDSRRAVSKKTKVVDPDEFVEKDGVDPEVVLKKNQNMRSEESERSRQIEKPATKRKRLAESDGSEDLEVATGTGEKLIMPRARKPPAKRRDVEADEPSDADKEMIKLLEAELHQPIASLQKLRC